MNELSKRPYRLLCIDDEPEQLMWIARYFEFKSGIALSVNYASTAETAFSQLDGSDFDLVTMDMMIPGINLEEVRHNGHPILRHIAMASRSRPQTATFQEPSVFILTAYFGNLESILVTTEPIPLDVQVFIKPPNRQDFFEALRDRLLARR